MKSFDTNVAVRLMVEDDVEQCERAAQAFRRAIADGGAFFSATVLIDGRLGPASCLQTGPSSDHRRASQVRRYCWSDGRT